MTKGVLAGYLMMDKIAPRNSIMWSCMSNAVASFVKDEFDTKDMMTKILGLANNKESCEKQISVYTNQWRFRSGTGVVLNLFYCFDKGALDINENSKQCINVSHTCDAIGVNTRGLICDGGGNNEEFMHTVSD